MTSQPSNGDEPADGPAEKPADGFEIGVKSLLVGAAFVYLVWRILAVAGYDGNTALGIIQVGGAGDASLGIALSSAGLVVLLVNLAWMLALFFDEPRWVAELPNDIKIVIFMPMLAPTLFLLPAFVSVVNVIFLLVMTIRWRRGSPKPRGGSAVFAGAIFLLWLAAPLWLQISTPWMPAEQFTPADGKPFTGYAVGEQDDDLVVLDRSDDEPYLRNLPLAGLKRGLCSEPEPWYLRTGPELFSDGARYDSCPDGAEEED